MYKLRDGRPIRSLEILASIQQIEKDFCTENGFQLENVSYWNPKPFFTNLIGSMPLDAPNPNCLTNYVYTSNITHHSNFIDKAEGKEDRTCLFTGSGTASIANVVAYLKNSEVKQVGILQPSYFSFVELCEFSDILTTSIDLNRFNDFKLPPMQELKKNGIDCIFLTNPIYGAGVYLRKRLSSWIDEAGREGLTVVVDESLALANEGIVRSLEESGNVIAIYVPHKALCLNGFRFSAVTYPNYLAKYFEQWSDLFDGGLSYSNTQAISHFCSEKFDNLESQVNVILERQGHLFKKIIDAFPKAEFDKSAAGHFRQVYLPNLSGELQMDSIFLRNIFYEAAASFIPSTRFGYSSKSNFSFRVNLFRLDEASAGGLHRLVRSLTT